MIPALVAAAFATCATYVAWEIRRAPYLANPAPEPTPDEWDSFIAAEAAYLDTEWQACNGGAS